MSPWTISAAATFPAAIYEEARTQKEFDLLEITYASDSLPVRGLLIKPKAPGTGKWPAIIFNRGGNGDLGRITDNGLPCGGMANTSCLDVADLYLFAKAGFVVIASDYRYQGATVKRDEWGGVEVDDVLNLVPALKSLDYVDPERLYMLGLSRGGTDDLSGDQTRNSRQGRRRHRRSLRRQSMGGCEAGDGHRQRESVHRRLCQDLARL